MDTPPPPDPPTWYHHRGGPVRLGPPLEGTRHARFAVVGGGLAGLSTALSLAERGAGAETVLLEAARIGHGASGRNGGMISAGFTRSLDRLVARLGRDRARTLFALSREALALVRRRIRTHAIACDPVDGVVEVSWFDDADDLRAYVELLRTFGHPAAFWPRERVRELWRSPRYHDAVFDPEGFHMDPLAYARGCARAAAAAGVGVFEASPVRRLVREAGRWRLELPRGRVYADTVILAPGAYGPLPHPALARATLGVVSYVVVTAPAAERLARTVAAPHAVFDDRMATGYFRPLAGGRLLWGGRVTLFESRDRTRIARLMRRELARVFPDLADLPFDFVWSGAMPFCRHKMPVVRPIDDGLWVATGFGGHGLNTTAMAGELVATALLEGDDRFRALDPFGLPPVLDGLGRLVAQLYYWAFRLHDAVRTRM